MTTTVHLYVDPNCPFAWITSRWLLNACEQSEGFAPELHVVSLYFLNEGRDLDPGYRKVTDRGFDAGRFLWAIADTQSQESLSAFYTAWGERFHVGDRKEDPRQVAVEALGEAGLDASLIEMWGSSERDDDLRAAQRAVEERVGNDVGTPVIAFDEGVAYFGPVLTKAPRGEDATRLLEGLHLMASVQGFSELKRARSGGLDFS